MTLVDWVAPLLIIGLFRQYLLIVYGLGMKKKNVYRQSFLPDTFYLEQTFKEISFGMW